MLSLLLLQILSHPFSEQVVPKTVCSYKQEWLARLSYSCENIDSNCPPNRDAAQCRQLLQAEKDQLARQLQETMEVEDASLKKIILKFKAR